jgi:hypothetical protein
MGSWIQTGRIWLGLAPLVLAAPLASANGGKVSCEILENGRPATGTIVLLAGDNEVADAACGKPVAVPSGADTAILRLDGALDGPEQRTALDAGKPLLRADFATGLLEVRIQSQGRDTAGIAVIRKNGKQIGTLGSGVTAHLSTGSYDVIARYRTRERRFEAVDIQPDRRTALNASFD